MINRKTFKAHEKNEYIFVFGEVFEVPPTYLCFQVNQPGYSNIYSKKTDGVSLKNILITSRTFCF